MTDPIKVGDLVELRDACCSVIAEARGCYGVVVRVDLIPSLCSFCGYITTSNMLAQVPDISSNPSNPGSGWVPVSWLRKVPGFPELADEKYEDRVPELVLK